MCILHGIFMEVISLCHLVDIIIPTVKVNDLRVKAVTRSPTKGKDKDSNAAPGVRAKCSISDNIGCDTQASLRAVGIPTAWLSLFQSSSVYSFF